MVVKSICIISTVDTTLSAFVLPVARELQSKGYAVTLLASMSDSFIKANQDEFSLIDLKMERGAKPIGMLKAIVSLYKIFRREKFDLVQYATPNASFYASVASKLAGYKKRLYCQWGIRYVGFESGFSRKLFKTLERITCKLSTHIRPASRKNMEFAISEGLYKASKASVVGDGGTIGVDSNNFDLAKKQEFRDSILTKHPTLKDKTVFGFIGRLDRDKGVAELFTAFLSLYEHYEDIALLVLGSFDKPEGIDKSLLESVQNVDSVIFTGHTREVANYLSSMDILVHPSYREGFSMVIQQAMFMEVAVLTTDIPGPSEVIENQVSGFAVKAKDATELQCGMKKLLDDEILRQRFAKAGYQRAVRLFSRERMVELTILDRNNILNK